MPTKLFQITPSQGGRLITDLSASAIGPADYTAKLNLIRIKDQECRRNGWLAWAPLPVIPNQGLFDVSEACIKAWELIRPNGDKAVVGCSRTKIKKFNDVTGAWDTIGSGYSADGVRWQIVTINGYAVFNNAVNLPVSWRVEDAAVTPIYELREVGVASVGRIAECSGFLMCADITEIRPAQLDHWMNGYASYVSAGNIAKAASFTALVGETANTYQVTTGGTNMVMTLPAVAIAGYAVALFYYVEKVDAGVGTVTVSPSIEDYAVVLDSIGDKALIWWDIILGKWSAVMFPSGTIPATDPYGLVPAAIDITQRIPWRVINSELGEPTRWAPVFTIYMPAASATITLPFASSVFIAGQTRVAVVNAGPLGGTLGGQELTPDGVMVLTVASNVLTLQETTNVDLDYPRVVQILRWTDISSLVGSYDLQGDNSEITSLATLRNWLVVCRTTGLYRGRYTGDPGAPFVFEPVYTGSNVPLWPDAIANITGDYLLYPSRGNRLFRYDGTTWPQIHEITDASATLFFDGVDQTTEVFCFDNPITKEIFWCYPEATLCYDYDGNTLSQMDAAFTAGAAVHKPGTSDEWVILAIDNDIFTYGLAYGAVPISTWLRDGVAADSVLQYGLWNANEQYHEKMLHSITPILSSQSPDTEMDVELGVSHNPNAAVTEVLVPPESLPTPAGYNYVACAFQATYMRPKITVTDDADVDFRLSMLILEAELVGGVSITRSVN